jgi:beta-glucosidase
MDSGHRQFPPGFLWGASTSSHQVEGGNRWNDWWESEQRGLLPFVSGDACRQYELFERDFEMARAWGHNAHRLSIEWSRIEPLEGQWSVEGMAHYRQVIRALRSRGLEPVVTLHHFTSPAWFAQRGGWVRGDSPHLFARYVEHVARQLGEPVTYWLTVNEPTVLVMQGYVTGEWPPFRKEAWAQAARALTRLARAHVLAYRALHSRLSNVSVSFAHNAPVILPCDRRRHRDRVAAAARDYVLNRLFFRLIGAEKRESLPSVANGTLDYVGINYYTRNFVRGTWKGLGAVVGRVCGAPHHELGPASTMGWEVFPDGLRGTLERFAAYGLPLLVTENGIATEDEELRRRFLVGHVAAAAEALTRGVSVIGYLYWSLIDNFEWAHGTRPRFGLAAVDFVSQERRARPIVEDYTRMIRTGRVSAVPYERTVHG